MPRTTSVPLLQNGFRPFFLAATIWAPMALAVWLAALAGFVEPPLALPAPAWHAHETPCVNLPRLGGGSGRLAWRLGS